VTVAGGIIYLDVDDEITSAASRIRASDGTRVAVVLPHGSRVATSRINFRLLARDALTSGKILSIVAADAGTRALAASAGLPMFPTVAEYEAAREEARAASGAESSAGVVTGPGLASGDASGGVVPDAGETEPMLVSETVVTASKPARRRPRGEAAASAAAAAAATTAAATAAATAAESSGALAAAGTATTTDAPSPQTSVEPRRAAARAPAAIPAARVVADTPVADRDRPGPPRAEPAGRFLRPSIGRTPLVVGLAVLSLAVVIGGVGAYLYLPTATAQVTPLEKTIGPQSLRIVASTSATEPDARASPPVVPARLLTIPLEASDTFPATGKRVEETTAKGEVRFDNLDPTSSNSIPKGSIVSTGSGVRFRTDKAVTVKRAELVGLTIVPSKATVKVTAVDAGPDGNVEPNTIRTVPRGEEPFFLQVTNPEATTGGSHTEFTRIKQEDVDKATAALTERLTAAFEERLVDPSLPGDAATVFPETKVLGAPVYAVDPATLVGQEVETFELAATASGTVVAVDTSPVQTVAEARIASSVEPGYALIDGSGKVDPAPAEISEGVITFPVVVTAREVLVLDPDVIQREIMGKPLAEARDILAGYGDAELTVWPDWVGTVPTIESRVEVTVSGDAARETAEPSPEASP
jgi:hypothetical protein